MPAWTQAAAYTAADGSKPAAIADFRNWRFAITAVSLAGVPGASAAQLSVLRSATFAEWIAFICASTITRTYVNFGGIIKEDIAVDTPRQDWTNGVQQLMLSCVSTNLCIQAGDISSASWTKVNTTVPAGAGLDPEGASTLTINNGAAVTVSHRVDSTAISFTSGTTYTFSDFGKSGTDTRLQMFLASASTPFPGNPYANYSLSAGTVLASGGTIVSAQVQPYTNSWTRTGFTAVAGGTGTGSLSLGRINADAAARAQTYTGDSTDILSFGAQVEAQPFATPWIRSVGAAATRNAENARLSPTLEAILQRTACTIIVQGQNSQRDTGRILGGATTDALLMRQTSTTLRANKTANLDATFGSGTFGAAYAASIAYDGTGRSLCANGGTVVTDANGAGDRTTVWLSRDASNPVTTYGDGWYDQVIVYPNRLTDGALATATIPFPVSPESLPIGENQGIWDALRSDLMVKDASNNISSLTSTTVRAIPATQGTGVNQPLFVPQAVTGEKAFIRMHSAATMTFPPQSNAYTENRFMLGVIRVPSWAAVIGAPLIFAVNGTGGSINMRQPAVGLDASNQTMNVRWKNSNNEHKLSSPAFSENTWVYFVSYIDAAGVAYLRFLGALVDQTTDPFKVSMAPNGASSGTITGVNGPWDFGYFGPGQDELTSEQVQAQEWALAQSRRLTLPTGHLYKTINPMAVPFYYPADVPVGSLGTWDFSHQGAALNLSGFTQTFSQDFSTNPLTSAEAGVGPLYCQGISDYGARITPDCDPITWAPSSDTSVYSVAGGKLTLSALHPGVAGTNWKSGTVQTVDWQGKGFSQLWGAWDFMMQMPLYDGDLDPEIWPALWLEGVNKQSDKTRTYPELDIIEAYGRLGRTTHSTAFRHRGDRAISTSIPTDEVSSAYDEQSGNSLVKLADAGGIPTALGTATGIITQFGVGWVRYTAILDPDNGFIVYINGIEFARHPLTPDQRVPLFALMSLQLVTDRKASNSSVYVTNLQTGSWSMDVDYIRCYQKAAWIGRT